MDENGPSRRFTLIEALITLLILGVLAVVALPALSNALAAQRVRSAGTILASSLLLAIDTSGLPKLSRGACA